MGHPVLILCGGQGTRIRGHAGELPKALVEVGGKPIVAHVIDLYAAQGMRDFRLAAGYRGDLLASWSEGPGHPEGAAVRCVDTGIETPTGGRVAALADELRGCGTFHLTYADGLADLDLEALEAEHARSGALAMVTVVRPELQFGVVELDDDGAIRGFREKPRSEHWVNGGFMCVSERALGCFAADSVLERDVLPALAGQGALHAYRHEGFWRCMDTYKDAVALDELCAAGDPPWLAAAAGVS